MFLKIKEKSKFHNIYVFTFKKVIIYNYNRLTIETFQHAFLNSNSRNLLQSQFKNQFPLFKLFRKNKHNNGQFKMVFFTELHSALLVLALWKKIASEIASDRRYVDSCWKGPTFLQHTIATIANPGFYILDFWFSVSCSKK